MAAKTKTPNTDNENTVTLTKSELKQMIEKEVSAATAKRPVMASKDEVENIPAGRENKKKVSKAQEDFLNEKVPVTLIKDNNEYAEDVTVTYNGINYRIKRGVTVMVPRFIKLIIDASSRQKLVANDFASNLSKIFMEKTEKVILGGKV